MKIDPSTTALILVDLQICIIAAANAPYPGSQVLANAASLADAFRAAGGLVVLVQASTGIGGALRLDPPKDMAMWNVPGTPETAGIAPELGPRPEDVVITKYNWGAFHGTDLELQLRRRGIDTLVVAGISTNFGVESTIRHAHERGFSQIVVEDACTAFDATEHHFPMTRIFPRIALVRSTDQLLAALA